MFVRTAFTTTFACLIFGTVSSGYSPADDLLSGPSIQDEEVTYQDMQTRRLQETGKSASLDSRQQLRFWMLALDSIDQTQKQKADIQAIINEYRIKQHEFQKMHGEEMSTIRKEQRRTRQNGEMLTDDSRKRMMELMALTPDPTTYQERAWALLTPDQQQTFKTRYQTILSEEIKKREAHKANNRHETDAMMQQDTDNKKSTDDVDRRRIDRQDRNDNFDNDDMLRRIRFLQRLRDLKPD